MDSFLERAERYREPETLLYFWQSKLLVPKWTSNLGWANCRRRLKFLDFASYMENISGAWWIRIVFLKMGERMWSWSIPCKYFLSGLSGCWNGKYAYFGGGGSLFILQGDDKACADLWGTFICGCRVSLCWSMPSECWMSLWNNQLALTVL